jgi:branched-chain amino acid transport system substrate-binding protein
MRHKALILTSALAAAALVAPAQAEDTKLGILLGFTGPLEALAPPIGAGAELAWQQVNEQGGLLDGQIVPVQGDSTCADATAAANTADRLVNAEGVLAIVGAMCSGATGAVANTVGVPTNTVMITPSATNPALTTLEDNDLLFRVTPSDAYQGQVMAKVLMDHGISDIAIAYVNNDYGKGFADALEAAYTALGGSVLANEAHEEGKADYRAELGSLAASGSGNLVLIAYAQGSGQTMLRQATESGDFFTYIGGDGMISDDLFTGIDTSALEGMIGTKPGTPDVPGADMFTEQATAAGLDPTAIYAPQGYDAAFLIALAIEKNGRDREGLSSALRAVSSPPGEVIYPGEWEKARSILDAGGDVNYEGAGGSLDFDEHGDVAGVVIELEVQGGTWVELGEAMAADAM